jgi:hypothetical protein
MVGVVPVVVGAAALEVLVHAGVAHRVEPLDRAEEADAIQLALVGELLERARLDEEALAQATPELLVGHGVPGRHRADRVAAPELRVEDEERLARRVARVHRPPRVQVGRRLVAESLPVSIHHQAPGHALLDHEHPGLARPGQQRHRRPPGLVHQVERASGRHAHLDAVTEVALVAGVPLGRRRLTEVLGPHHRVAFEAAGPEQHALPRADPTPRGDHAHHAAPLHEEGLHGALEADLDPSLQQRHPEARDERVARVQLRVPVEAAPLEPTERVLDHAGEDLDRGGQAGHQEAMRLARLDAEPTQDLRLRVRRPELEERVAEQRRVERQRLHRPAAGLPARGLAVVVAVLLQGVELQPGVLRHVVVHATTLRDIRAQPRLLDLPERDVLEVAERILGRVLDPPAGQLRVVRDPDHPARDRRGSAVEVRRLEDQDAGAQVVRADRRREARGPGAHADEVDLLVERAVVRRRAGGRGGVHGDLAK